MKQTTETDI